MPSAAAAGVGASAWTRSPSAATRRQKSAQAAPVSSSRMLIHPWPSLTIGPLERLDRCKPAYPEVQLVQPFEQLRAPGRIDLEGERPAARRSDAAGLQVHLEGLTARCLAGQIVELCDCEHDRQD